MSRRCYAFYIMNSHICYKLTKTTIMLSENTPVISYGIDIVKDGKKLISYEDILPDKQKVEALVDLCNDLDAAPEHMPDILEDFLP